MLLRVRIHRISHCCSANSFFISSHQCPISFATIVTVKLGYLSQICALNLYRNKAEMIYVKVRPGQDMLSWDLQCTNCCNAGSPDFSRSTSPRGDRGWAYLFNPRSVLRALRRCKQHGELSWATKIFITLNKNNLENNPTNCCTTQLLSLSLCSN
jgi:hypothetical protein